MKEYPKTYEDTYSRPEALKKCKIEHVTTDKGMSASEYRDFCRENMQYTMEALFGLIVRFVWQQHRFTYMGHRRKKTGNNYFLVDGAFGVFMRHFVGVDYRVFSRNYYYTKIVSYMHDFFVDFDDHNPFEEPEYFKYPYKHVTLDYLTVVTQMPQRLDLLQLAEEKKMMWDEFFDYVVNYALCCNDEAGRKIFTVINPRFICPPYVRNNLKRHKTGKYKKEL